MNTKRYLVTYAERPATLAVASALLARPLDTVFEGVARLSAGPASDDVLHFESLGISALTLADDEAAVLAARPGILAVEEDPEVRILGDLIEVDPPSPVATAAADATVTALWNMNLVKAPQAWANGWNGTGINIAVLDTGIASHPDLVIAGGISFVPGVTSYNDGNGHGTHCAGIVGARNGLNNVYGVAPQCGLYAVKVLSDAGSGSGSWIIGGMQWCISNQIQVASMSLGSISGPNTAWATAVKTCQDAGVIVVCAAGNSFQTAFPWVNAPANSIVAGQQNESPVAVAAVDSNSVVASFSSRGGQTTPWNQVAVSAPGVAIYSTYLNNGYATMSGTSMACPHVAGLGGLVYQRYPGINPHLAHAKMASNASNLGTGPYPNTPYGYGLINCDQTTR